MIALLLFLNLCQAAITKIVVLDTGIDIKKTNVPLCKNGHRDFTLDKNPFIDKIGHGSNVTQTIYNNSNKNVCFIIVKYFTLKNKDAYGDMQVALEYVTTLNDYKILNISAGGKGKITSEYINIKKILDKGKVIVAAAGNEKDLLSISNNHCNYYPACLDRRVWVVANNHPSHSNYGFIGDGIDIIIDGNNINAAGITLSGSSQSAAIFSGKLTFEKNTCI